MGISWKRLAALAAAGASAVAIGLGTAGPAAAVQWNPGANCDAAVYKFCFYENPDYSGAAIGVPWNDIDGSPNFHAWPYLDDKISSVKNNMGYPLCLYRYENYQDLVLTVSPFHQLSRLSDYGADNKVSSFIRAATNNGGC
ncbi:MULTISPECIES: peptidase inhibitor family I36 protein [Streptomyces]|uniref:peptidase inhibitor family I36 protein n=1 Tax=Streptomyces TaxID=1883 RepID=UPI0023DD468A|nr:peptidase inhibitor family I36 protein [Streptomyces sp. FXJ1.172]WEP00930.1 peptidase inhibitor family I36 protein [Streptomyces sp. FXJ1.172]